LKTDRGVQTLAVGGRTVKMNLLTLQKSKEKQVALYLYKADHEFTSNYYVQQLKIILNGMLRREPNSALISMSSFASGDDVGQAIARVRKFAQEAIPTLEEYLP
jgi:EpsI family protein